MKFQKGIRKHQYEGLRIKVYEMKYIKPLQQEDILLCPFKTQALGPYVLCITWILNRKSELGESVFLLLDICYCCIAHAQCEFPLPVHGIPMYPRIQCTVNFSFIALSTL